MADFQIEAYRQSLEQIRHIQNTRTLFFQVYVSVIAALIAFISAFVSARQDIKLWAVFAFLSVWSVIQTIITCRINNSIAKNLKTARQISVNFGLPANLNLPEAPLQQLFPIFYFILAIIFLGLSLRFGLM